MTWRQSFVITFSGIRWLVKIGDYVLLQNHSDQGSTDQRHSDETREVVDRTHPAGPWRVLLAEDDTLLANTVDDFLTDEGFTVSLAGDGEDALQKAAFTEFDVLLTDLRMPRVDGVELIRRLRASRPDLPVVIMSGNAPADLRESVTRGGEGPLVMVAKPMRLMQLLGALNDVLGQHLNGR